MRQDKPMYALLEEIAELQAERARLKAQLSDCDQQAGRVRELEEVCRDMVRAFEILDLYDLPGSAVLERMKAALDAGKAGGG